MIEWTVVFNRFEVFMQANMLSTEYDEISDMHKKILRASTSHFEMILAGQHVIMSY